MFSNFLAILFKANEWLNALVWGPPFADTLNGLMAAPNLIALIALAGVVVREKAKLLAGRD